MNKKNYCKHIICELDDEEHLAPVFGKKSKSVQENANIFDFTTEFLSLTI